MGGECNKFLENDDCVDKCSTNYYINGKNCITSYTCMQNNGFIRISSGNSNTDNNCYENCSYYTYKIVNEGGYCLDNCGQYFLVNNTRNCINSYMLKIYFIFFIFYYL